MPSDFYPIPTPANGRLVVVARPRGGDWLAADVNRWQQAGVNTVVSLLMPDELTALKLEQEAETVRAAGMQFLSLPIVDRGIPVEHSHYLEFVSILAKQIREGRTVAIHCRMSVGRAPMLAANVLIRLGMNVDEAIEAVSVARGIRIPETFEQLRWIDNYAKSTALTAA